MRSARDSGTAASTVVALRWSCEILLELGRKEAAARDLEQARHALNEVHDPEVRAILEAVPDELLRAPGQSGACATISITRSPA